MSFIKSFILGIILVVTSVSFANASMNTKPVTRADAKAYAKIDHLVLEAESLTGESADFISAILLIETNFGRNMVNPYSGVKGYMQYSDRQWRNDVKQHSKKLGLSAKSSVHNKRANILVGAAGLAENRKYLERNTKRAVSDGDVYMSWFIGLYGTERILKGDPNAKISKYVKLKKGNKRLYMVNGRVATVAEFRNKMNNMISGTKKQVGTLVNRSKFDAMIASLQHAESDYQTAMLPPSRGYQ